MFTIILGENKYERYDFSKFVGEVHAIVIFDELS